MATFDTERFIDEIKQRKAIWDTSIEDYKNKILKAEQWRQVCSAVYPDFDGLSAQEKWAINKELQAKWKNIRDSYTRFLRMKTTKSGKKFVKLYVYAEQLEFIKGISIERRTESSLQTEVSENNTDKEDDDDDDDDDGGCSSSVGNQNDNERAEVDQSPNYSANTLSRRRKRILEQKIENYIDNYQREKNSRTVEPSCNDMDFFRSLLPVIKALPLNQRMKFRMDVMKMALQYSENSEKSHAPVMVPPPPPPFQRHLTPSRQFHSAVPPIQHFPQQSSNGYTLLLFENQPNNPPIHSPGNFPTNCQSYGQQADAAGKPKPRSPHSGVLLEFQQEKEGGQSPPGYPQSSAESHTSFMSDTSEQVFKVQDFQY